LSKRLIFLVLSQCSVGLFSSGAMRRESQDAPRSFIGEYQPKNHSMIQTTTLNKPSTQPSAANNPFGAISTELNPASKLNLAPEIGRHETLGPFATKESEIHSASVQSAPEPSLLDQMKRHVLTEQTIHQGDLLHLALEALAGSAGWTFIWYPNVSWRAVADIDLRAYSAPVTAVIELVRVMRQEGKPIQLRISQVNHVMEVLSTEVLHD